jgi:ABC-2 type transport system ATP-binding protein
MSEPALASITKAAINVEHLSRAFGAIQAVDDLTFAVPQGSVFGFLGPNGAGKTTTIRLLLGLIPPTSGSAHVLGFDTRTEGDQIRQHTGALLEHAGLYERLSAYDNLEFAGRVNCMPGPERRTRIEELLTHFGLWDRRDQRAGEWSRGMKQKLAVARAVLNRPAIVFLDEPTAGLDPEASVSLRADLVSLAAKDGTTIFLTTHNLAEAERICHLVAVIRSGRLLTVGSPAQLRAQSGSPQVTFSGAGFTPQVIDDLRHAPGVTAVHQEDGRLTAELGPDGRIPLLVRLLVEAGAELEEVRPGQTSLEDAFLTLMEQSQ